MRDAVLSKVLALQSLSLAELRQQYLQCFPDEKVVPSNKAYLQRRLAHCLQELAFGGLSQQAEERLEQLTQQYDPINRKPEKRAPSPGIEVSGSKPLRDRRLPIPGTILTKVYKGTPFQVKALEKSFEFQGKTYRSLTAIAKIITGMHWNGYLFFGL
jgi:hypothetical protein